MAVNEAYNYKNINESVSTSGLLNEDQLGELKAEGYQVVINLLPDDSQYAVANERTIVEGQDLNYIPIPVDFSAPTTENYLEFSTAMIKHSDKKVLAHCAANFRVSAFYAIYAHKNLEWSATQSESFIDSMWKLDEHPQWRVFVTQALQREDD